MDIGERWEDDLPFQHSQAFDDRASERRPNKKKVSYMKRDLIEFQHFVANVQHETRWPLVQYAQYDPTRHAVSIGAHCTGSGDDVLQRPATSAIEDPWWPLEANPLWLSVYCEAQTIRVSIRDYMERYSPITDVDRVSRIWQYEYVSLTPVRVRDLVKGAILAYSSKPWSRFEEINLARYAREAQGLERVAELEERAGLNAAHLKTLMTEITHLQDRTAQAIADHLHGKVQSHLLVAWHQLQQCQELLYDNPHQVRELLNTSMEILDTVREQQIRQLCHAIHPGLIRIALVPALKHLVERFSSCFEVDLKLDSTVSTWDGRLDSPVTAEKRMALYRVVEEALSNLVRHSLATRADIALDVDRQTVLELNVVDNGKPWNIDVSAPHLGLFNMMTRADEVGGTLEFTHSAHQNQMVLRIPLGEPHEAGQSRRVGQ